MVLAVAHLGLTVSELATSCRNFRQFQAGAVVEYASLKNSYLRGHIYSATSWSAAAEKGMIRWSK